MLQWAIQNGPLVAWAIAALFAGFACLLAMCEPRPASCVCPIAVSITAGPARAQKKAPPTG
jgi:hypothetical protein